MLALGRTGHPCYVQFRPEKLLFHQGPRKGNAFDNFSYRRSTYINQGAHFMPSKHVGAVVEA